MPQLDVSTYTSQLFWLVICFFTMYFIMAKIIIPRIADIMEQRQNKIDDYLGKADNIRQEAEQSLEKYRKALNDATTEANRSLERTQIELNTLIRQKQEELDARLREKISAGEKEIRTGKEEALKQIHTIAEGLALEITRKIGLADISAQQIKTAGKKVKTWH